ncbi:unnamed protein product [Diatraea saccharalis]|uniref:Uncharacterized protein n=1 Tax=Diatraea saccharalis TaxID=40085 RepID=A0A9N9WD24_9NEOP|nr:unnamed protein product [Diatraea saccharalis]
MKAHYLGISKSSPLTTSSFTEKLDGSLYIPLIGTDDAGLYECGVENETTFLDRINLTVRRKPIKTIPIDFLSIFSRRISRPLILKSLFI